MMQRRRVQKIPASQGFNRKRFNQPEEISFDFSARQDYLTGFHKRKLDRIKHAQDLAAKREKETRLETRRQLRSERKEQLERYVKSVAELMAKDEAVWEGGEGSDDSGDEWTGIPDEKPIDYEENYSDEDRNTTVVIEEVDITRQGFQKVMAPEDMNSDEQKHTKPVPDDVVSKEGKDTLKKRKWTKDAPKRDKQKKKKFRYETKAERKVTRSKERSTGAKAKARRKG